MFLFLVMKFPIDYILSNCVCDDKPRTLDIWICDGEIKSFIYYGYGPRVEFITDKILLRNIINRMNDMFKAGQYAIDIDLRDYYTKKIYNYRIQ